ncbi:hypothetical protein Hanom_Chr07g00637591 [Helianthus anomalus]
MLYDSFSFILFEEYYYNFLLYKTIKFFLLCAFFSQARAFFAPRPQARPMRLAAFNNYAFVQKFVFSHPGAKGLKSCHFHPAR